MTDNTVLKIIYSETLFLDKNRNDILNNLIFHFKFYKEHVSRKGRDKMRLFLFLFFASFLKSEEISALEKAIRAIHGDLEHFDYLESLLRPKDTERDEIDTVQWFYY